mgnify:FL=1
MTAVGGAEASRGLSMDAVVLAGGRGSRLGGVDKAGIVLNGERLVDRAVAAARANGAECVVIVGPGSAQTRNSILVREDPPLTGPLAALAAALPEVQAESLLLLSCDLVLPSEVCRMLAAHSIPAEFDGVVLRDRDQRPQWLAGVYRVAALRAEFARLGASIDHAPLRTVLSELQLQWIDAPAHVTADIDEAADLDRARSALERVSTGSDSDSSAASTAHEDKDAHG